MGGGLLYPSRHFMSNKVYNIINFHVLTNDTNRKDIENIENFWGVLKETMDKIPKHHSTILMGDFNA